MAMVGLAFTTADPNSGTRRWRDGRRVERQVQELGAVFCPLEGTCLAVTDFAPRARARPITEFGRANSFLRVATHRAIAVNTFLIVPAAPRGLLTK